MIKYSEFDIRDGLASLKIGINNILYYLWDINNRSTVIELPFKLSTIIITGVIKELFPDIIILYGFNKLVLKSKNEKDIYVESHEDKTRFFTKI